MKPVDHQDRCRRLVDGGGQRLGRDVDELPDAEGRVLVEGPRPAEVDAGEQVRVGRCLVAVHGQHRAAGHDVLPDAGKDLDHAVVRRRQVHQPRPVYPQHCAEHGLVRASVAGAQMNDVRLGDQHGGICLDVRLDPG